MILYYLMLNWLLSQVTVLLRAEDSVCPVPVVTGNQWFQHPLPQVRPSTSVQEREGVTVKYITQ